MCKTFIFVPIKLDKLRQIKWLNKTYQIVHCWMFEARVEHINTLSTFNASDMNNDWNTVYGQKHFK